MTAEEKQDLRSYFDMRVEIFTNPELFTDFKILQSEELVDCDLEDSRAVFCIPEDFFKGYSLKSSFPRVVGGTFMRTILRKCQGTGCKSEAKIQQKLAEVNISLLSVSNSYNADGLDEPIVTGINFFEGNRLKGDKTTMLLYL
jgi:hypothetical protein